MFIRTERLFLRPAWEEDAPALTRAIAHEQVARMLARVPWPYEEGDAIAWIGAPRDPFLPSLLVTVPDLDGQIIGGCGLHCNGPGNPVKVGYWITPAMQGRGFAQEALGALLQVARAIGHQRLGGRHMADNPASGGVLLAAGFTPTGRTNTVSSLARGEQVASIEYTIELTPRVVPVPVCWTTPAPYVAGINAAA
jgi:RimJ/RimL family protein N-acetyltransferase